MIKFLKNNGSNIFLSIIFLFLLFSGKFNILLDKGKAFLGQDKGKLVEDFIVKDISNNNKIQLSELKGKVVLVNFWATWCPPCRIEIPSLVELYNTYHNQGFEIIGVSVDQDGTEVVQKFVKENKLNYPVTMYNKELRDIFGEIVGVPTSFLINKEGKIEAKYPGFYPKWSFEKDIKRLLQK